MTNKDKSEIRTIALKIQLPNFSRLKHTLSRLTKKAKLILLALVISIIVIITLIVLSAFTNEPNQDNPHGNGSAANKAGANALPTLAKGTPSFDTITPNGEAITKLGGWTRISPPNKNPAYAYVDDIGNAKLSVTEQPLPDSFKADTDSKISQLADSYHATASYKANGTTIYVASSGAGAQSAIFTKNGLLVLIKSTQPLSSEQWSSYVNNLN